MRRIAVMTALLAAGAAQADEGMWTFDNFPQETVRQKYGVDINDAWLNRVQRSIARHESGCTGSFVSADGLVLTNHHCVMDCLAELSTETSDYIENGFSASARSGERKCPTEILSVLMDVEDITERVNAATRGMSDAQANEARKRELSRLEAQCVEASKKDRGTGAGLRIRDALPGRAVLPLQVQAL